MKLLSATLTTSLKLTYSTRISHDVAIKTTEVEQTKKFDNSILTGKTFSISYVLEKKVRPGLKHQTLRCTGNCVTSGPSEKDSGNCEGSIKKRVEFLVRKVLYRRSSSRLQDTCSRKS